MSYKLASYVSLLLFFLVGLAFFMATRAMPQGDGHDIGPGVFPGFLSLMMMATAVIGVFTTWRREQDTHLEIAKPFNLAVTFAAIIGLFAIWYLTGVFFPFAFLAVSTLLYLLNPQPNSWRKAAKSIAIGAVVMVIVYLIFDVLLGLRF